MLLRIWRSITGCSVSILSMISLLTRSLTSSQANIIAENEVRISDGPPAYPETEKVMALIDEPHSIDRPGYVPLDMELSPMATQASLVGHLGPAETPELLARNTAFTPELSGYSLSSVPNSGIVELSSNQNGDHAACRNSLPGETQSPTSTPVSPLSTAGRNSWRNSGGGDLSPIDVEFMSSQEALQHPTSPVFEMNPQNVAQATYESRVTSAQGPLTVSPSVGCEQINDATGTQYHDLGNTACAEFGEFQQPRYGILERPLSDISSDASYHTLGTLDAEALQYQYMQDVGLTPLSPTRTFVAADSDQMSDFLDAASTYASPPHNHCQTALRPISEALNDNVGPSAYLPFSDVLGVEDNSQQMNYNSTDNNATTHLYRQSIASFNDSETSTLLNYSPTSANVPTLSPTSTMTMVDSPHTPSDLEMYLGGYDMDAPIFDPLPTSNGDFWRRHSDPNIELPQEILEDVAQTHQYGKAALQGVVRAPLEPEVEAETASAAKKLNTRRRKKDPEL